MYVITIKNFILIWKFSFNIDVLEAIQGTTFSHFCPLLPTAFGKSIMAWIMCHVFFFISAYMSMTSDVQKFYTVEPRVTLPAVSFKVVWEIICLQSINIRGNRGNTHKDLTHRLSNIIRK